MGRNIMPLRDWFSNRNRLPQSNPLPAALHEWGRRLVGVRDGPTAPADRACITENAATGFNGQPGAWFQGQSPRNCAGATCGNCSGRG